MSGPTFRIAGIPVRIDLTFLLIAFLLGWGVRSGPLLVAWIVIVTGSVLLHELGHAIAFRRYGQQPQILLQGMGGLTSGSGEPLTPRRDIVVSLAGPLTGMVLLGLPALLLARSSTELSPDWETILADIVFVNLAWSVVNLLPVLPLDGGRVSAALWALRTGGAGERQAHVLSAVVAGAGATFALSAGYLFGAMFAGFFAAYNISQLSAARNQGLQQQLVDGWRSLGRGNAAEAAVAAQTVLSDKPSAAVMAQASELLAWARLGEGNRAGAEEAVRRLPHGGLPSDFLQAALDLDAGLTDEALDHLVAGYGERRSSPASAMVADTAARLGLADALSDRLLASGDGQGAALLAVHLHAAGRFDEAARVGQQAFAANPEAQARVAYNVACSLARAGHSTAALDWLERADTLGFSDRALIDSDSDLDGLRSKPRFAELQRRLNTDP